jgi:hypothetical protein
MIGGRGVGGVTVAGVATSVLGGGMAGVGQGGFLLLSYYHDILGGGGGSPILSKVTPVFGNWTKLDKKAGQNWTKIRKNWSYFVLQRQIFLNKKKLSR